MRWIGHIIGEENFRTAVLSFVAMNRYSSISGEDFRLHLESYAKGALLPEDGSLSEVIRASVSAMPNAERLDVYIEEGRFGVYRWIAEFADLSVDYKTPTIQAASKPKLWLERSSHSRFSLDIELEPWIIANPDQYGIYAVNYNSDLWAELAKQLKENHEMFNRGQLISDAFSLARSDSTRLKNYLNLIEYLPKETDTLTWRAVRISYERLMVLLRGYEGDLEALNEYFISLAGDLYLKHRIGGEMLDFEMTMELAKIVCAAGLPECLQDVRDYYETGLETGNGVSGSSDFQQFVYCTLVRNSSDVESLVGRVLGLWIENRKDYSRSRNAIKGLACTSDLQVIQRFLDMSVSDQDFGVTLSPSERRFLLFTFMRGSYESLVESLNFLLENFSIVHEMVDSVQKLFYEFRYNVKPHSIELMVDEIVKAHEEEMGELLVSYIYLENIYGTVYFLGDNSMIQSQLDEWLADRPEPEPEPDHGVLLKPFEFLTFFALILSILTT